MSSDNDSSTSTSSEALKLGLALLEYAWPDLTLSKIMKAKPKVTDHDYFEATVGLIEDGRSLKDNNKPLTTSELTEWLAYITRKDGNGYFETMEDHQIDAVSDQGKGSFTVRPRGVHSAHFDNI